jgi:hypothetical protein
MNENEYIVQYRRAGTPGVQYSLGVTSSTLEGAISAYKYSGLPELDHVFDAKIVRRSYEVVCLDPSVHPDHQEESKDD